MAKIIHDATFIGENGIAVVQRVLMEMRYAWQPTGRFDAGIDGYIELRDTQTKEMLGAHLGAQVKARARFTRETETTFEFLCDQEDVDYWMRCNVPVLLICVRSDTKDAWFVCATEYFKNPDARAARRVVFDKTENVFDARAASRLRDLALPLDSGVPRQGLTGPETLLTNLLPVQHGRELWSAPTDFWKVEQANARYAQVGGPRASDYLLRDSRLYSLRDPRDCALSGICDAPHAEVQSVGDWSGAEGDLQGRFADLLRRTLLQQLKPRIQWQPAKSLFYFASPDAESISLTGPSGHSRQVISVKRFTGKDGVERVSHIKHLAFPPSSCGSTVRGISKSRPSGTSASTARTRTGGPPSGCDGSSRARETPPSRGTCASGSTCSAGNSERSAKKRSRSASGRSEPSGSQLALTTAPGKAKPRGRRRRAPRGASHERDSARGAVLGVRW